MGASVPIVELGPGDFVAEVGQLSGRPALVDVHAIDGVEALFPPENLRALMIAEPALGDRIMQALILRRVVLIETAQAAGPDRSRNPSRRGPSARLHGPQWLSMPGARSRPRP